MYVLSADNPSDKKKHQPRQDKNNSPSDHVVFFVLFVVSSFFLIHTFSIYRNSKSVKYGVNGLNEAVSFLVE